MLLGTAQIDLIDFLDRFDIIRLYLEINNMGEAFLYMVLTRPHQELMYTIYLFPLIHIR